MNKFFALIKKETLVLSKDIHGLLVLFVMPAIFILIMSLAMQDAFDDQQNVIVNYAISDQANNEFSKRSIESLQENNTFKAQVVQQDPGQLNTLVAEDRYKFAVIVPEKFTERLMAEDSDAVLAEVLISPTAKPYLKQLFLSALHGVLVKQKMALSFAAADTANQDSDTQATIERINKVNINTHYVFEDHQQETTPSSVQQNVPAWLMFAMFFVIIPISTAFIIEKQHGTFVRLRLMNVSAVSLLLAKFAPYYVVNQIQMVLMILVGMYLVPLLGGDRLDWPSSVGGLLIISSAASFAAIGFALLIATIAKTTVQATTMGGVFNIIFGALGGIMVPKFVMPPTMQDITVISPMSWGLEGFLDVFLRNHPWQAVIPEAGALMLFGAVCLFFAAVLFKRIV